MLEMWLSKERLLWKSTPRFLTDDEESREQPSSVRQCSSLLLVWFLGLIINTCFFQNLVVRNYSSSSFLYRLPTVFKSSQKNVVIDRVERSAKIQEH